MKPRSIFKLAVRILGLIFLYHGLSALPEFFQAIFSNFSHTPGFFLLIVWPLAVGCFLLRFAPQFTEFFYPQLED